MFKLKRTINIAASHSLKGHPKCGKMHGHNYNITVTVEGEDYTSDGMVIDFGELKNIMNSVIGKYDHMHIGRLPDGWQGNPDHIIEVPFEFVSSENLAKHWGLEIQEKLSSSLRLCQVEVQETPNNIAIWENK
ncbi:MAG: 6-pyruvoyl trahydropterin synthase family protein [Candidatus Hodarchaeales archaeon]|jgi:6-pyruvoyltetrahydropterin/6-carboxytetrahydropterin synthase